MAIALNLFLYVPVFAQAFYEMLTVPDTSNFERVQIDESYDLYVKRICKKTINKIAEPCNCFDLANFTLDEVVEYEYLFLSKKHERIIVINYIKDRNQKFYNNPSANLFETKADIKDVEVNIWYINQLRFGNYNSTSKIARFQTTFNPYSVHKWKLDIDKDTIEIHSVAVELKDGIDEKNSEKSMALVPIFLRADNFRIIYQQPSRDSNFVVHPLPNNNIYVDTVNGYTFFIFNEDVSKGRRTIKFLKNRRYSYFLSRNTNDDK